MAIMKVFAVYDSKAVAFLQPFFSESVGSAVRAFGDAANEEKSPLSRHAGDYQLYEIGTFDNNTGVLTAMVPQKLLGCAADFIEVKRVPSLADFKKSNVAEIVQEAISNGSQEG